MDFAGKEGAQPSNCRRNMTEEDLCLEMVKSFLNWLTHHNFEIIKDGLVRTIRAAPSAFVLKSLVSSVFDMAVADDSHSLFGNLCVKLSCELPPVLSDESFGEHITFKKLLMNKCRKEFDRVNSVTERLAQWYDEEALRLRLVRIVWLLAELFKCRVVAETTCQSIIQVLMEPIFPPERNIEAVYLFLSSIGREVDAGPVFLRLLDAHSKRLDNLLQNPLLSPSSRGMIFKLKHLVKTKANASVPLEIDKNWGSFHGEAATTMNTTSSEYSAGVLKPQASRNLLATQSVKDIDGDDVREKLGMALENLRLSKQETCKERVRRVAAEKDASTAIHKVLVLESKYNDELRVRKETEDALAKEREELEMVQELFQSYKKERDSMELQTGLLEGKYNDELRLRKETEDKLAKEREEREKMKQLLETCKEEQQNMHFLTGVLEMKYNDESRLREQTEAALGREKEEVVNMKRILETCQEERDNALRTAEELEKKQAEGQETPSSFVCPITQDVMKDPQVAADGFTYEAEAIRRWMERGHDTSPMTNLRLSHRALVPNYSLRSVIQDWLQRQTLTSSLASMSR